MHFKGEDGAQRAKRWLDATTRTRSSWTNKEDVAAGRLTYNWPHAGGEEFSFDVGGILYGDPFDNHNFVAEVKNYSGDTLGGHYDKFLAQCYLVYKDHSRWVNQFMFLTWHPFRVKTWTQLCETDAIVEACVEHRKRLFDTDDEGEAKNCIDMSVVEALAPRLWLVVLSTKQEKLLISDDDRALIVHDRVRRGLA